MSSQSEDEDVLLILMITKIYHLKYIYICYQNNTLPPVLIVKGEYELPSGAHILTDMSHQDNGFTFVSIKSMSLIMIIFIRI